MLDQHLPRGLAVHRKSTLTNGKSKIKRQKLKRVVGFHKTCLLPLFLPFAFCLSVTRAEYRVIPVTHGGTLKGMVKFATETPPRFMYTNRQEDHCPHGIPQQNLIVNQETRGIQNVLIVLDIPEGKAAPLMKPDLNNQGCVFVPHLQWASKDSTLLIKNSDPAVHNVHALRQDVTAFTVTIEPGAPPVRRPLVETGFYKIDCDRHLWMRAWIYVSEHPYVAVTDTGGRFVLTEIPPGSYDLRAWHEGWIERGTEPTGQIRFERMQQVMRVVIQADQTTEVLLDDLKPTFF